MEDRCRRIAEIVPFVVNGSATRHERWQVCVHTATCPACRADYVRAIAWRRNLTDVVSRWRLSRASQARWAAWVPDKDARGCITTEHLLRLLRTLQAPTVIIRAVETAVNLKSSLPQPSFRPLGFGRTIRA